jgi:hypothetical protein
MHTLALARSTRGCTTPLTGFAGPARKWRTGRAAALVNDLHRPARMKKIQKKLSLSKERLRMVVGTSIPSDGCPFSARCPDPTETQTCVTRCVTYCLPSRSCVC